MVLPCCLQDLTFDASSNLSLEKVTLPDGLLSGTLGAGFSQSLEKVAMPCGLQSLTFGPDVHPGLGGGGSAIRPAEFA